MNARWSPAIARAAWPVSRIDEALVALARHVALEPTSVSAAMPTALDPARQRAWIEATARSAGIDAERIDVRYDAIESALDAASASVVPLATADEAISHVVLIVSPGRLLAPDLSVARVRTAELQRAVCASVEEAPSRDADVLFERAGIDPRRRARARGALLAQQLADTQIAVHVLRPAPDGSARQLVAPLHPVRTLLSLGAAHGLYLVLWVLAWWLVGRAVLDGRLDRGWLGAWMLLLATLVPLRVWAVQLQGRIAVAAGRLLKARLLVGALRLDPDTVLATGAGHLLGRAIEAEAVETLALSGGFAAIVAVIELAVAAAILAVGYSPWLMLVLVAWSVLALVLGRGYDRAARRWSAHRLTMTDALVERMVGQRTRLAQDDPARWHDREDEELDRYLHVSRQRDVTETRLLAFVPQGWLVVGLVAVGPAFVRSGVAPASLAAALGGMLLATRAFHRAASAMWQVIDARVAWQQVTPLVSHVQPETPGAPTFAVAHTPRAGVVSTTPVLDVQGLSYRYPSRQEPVLQRCQLRIMPGERVLLEGESGGGKSTLVAVITGLREPQAGLLLAGGLDQATLGADGWRRRIVAAPQFHQNHVITGPLSYNLLMGRGSFTPADVDEAAQVCQELGLGPLLDRMPGGLSQMVGETGWQLSQGERSRVFLARAVLQNADLVVLDESLGALDPETLEQAVACVLKRAPALVVIAHA